MTGYDSTPDRHSGVRLVAIMGAIIFCVEGLLMLALSHLTISAESLLEALTDSTILTITVAPLTYFFLLRPHEHQISAANEALSAALEASRRSETDLVDAIARLNVQKAIVDRHCLVSQTDLRGRITYANDEFCRVSGYSRDELIGMNHRVVKSGHHPVGFWMDMYATIAREGIWQGQVCNRAKDGSLYWVQATNVAERDGSGQVNGHISVRSNITELKQREQQLNEAHADLKQAIARTQSASLAKSNFLSTMSHEMRTPLNGVIGALELLRLEALTERQKDLVDLAGQSSEALLVHINDVLDFSKMEAGKLDLVSKPFNLPRLVCSVADIVMPQVRHGRNTVKIEIASDVPDGLIGDQVRLRQILLNFISNAAKFTRDGTITVSVKRAAGSTVHDGIEFAVSDTGLGIASDKLGELFKQFSMVDSSYTRRTAGTGLGLAISKTLAEMMGGNIGVESEEGRGSRFWFTAKLPEASDTGACADHATGATGAVHCLKVLLVDDNATNRVVGSQLLAAAGHQARLVSSGRQALEAAAEQPFDVILMDISMPDMDGLEVTRHIRAGSSLNRETPIVALTAHAVVGDRERFLAAGMNAYLSKPMRLADLEARLASIEPRTAEPDGAEAAMAEGADGATATESDCGDVQPILDPSELAVLAAETSPEVALTAIAEFRKELASRVAELAAAAADHRSLDIQAAAHAISGAASSIGAVRLATLAKSIELDCARELLDVALTRTRQLPELAGRTEEACRAYEGTSTASAARAA